MDKDNKKNLGSKKRDKKKIIKKSEPSLEEQLAQAQKDLLYLRADFDNYKKNSIKERSELLRYGGENFILAFIDEVLDDWERARKNFEEEKSLENFKSGMDLIYTKLEKLLASFQVKSKDCEGEPFNPQHHEALSRQKNSKVPENHIVAVFKKPYYLFEKLIRVAQVVVSEGSEE